MNSMYNVVGTGGNLCPHCGGAASSAHAICIWRADRGMKPLRRDARQLPTSYDRPLRPKLARGKPSKPVPTVLYKHQQQALQALRSSTRGVMELSAPLVQGTLTGRFRGA